MKRYGQVLALVTTIAVAPTLARADGTGARTILDIGCTIPGDICYVTVDGAAAGPSQCSSTSLRWSIADAGGREILSLLYGAFLAGKRVNFFMVTDCCFARQNNFPTFAYIYVMR
jgi:hypothetical protein